MNFTADLLPGAGLIFLLRVGDMSLDTLRFLTVMRGRKLPAWLLGFLQSLIFVVAIGSVLSHLDNIYNILGYAAGFATGNVIGMFLEEKLALGYTRLTIVSSTHGAAIAEGIRSLGFAITEVPARGKDGTVTLLHCSLNRKKTAQVYRLIEEIDAKCFITTEEIRPLHRGFWGAR